MPLAGLLAETRNTLFFQNIFKVLQSQPPQARQAAAGRPRPVPVQRRWPAYPPACTCTDERCLIAQHSPVACDRQLRMRQGSHAFRGVFPYSANPTDRPAPGGNVTVRRDIRPIDAARGCSCPRFGRRRGAYPGSRPLTQPALWRGYLAASWPSGTPASHCARTHPAHLRDISPVASQEKRQIGHLGIDRVDMAVGLDAIANDEPIVDERFWFSARHHRVTDSAPVERPPPRSS